LLFELPYLSLFHPTLVWLTATSPLHLTTTCILTKAPNPAKKDPLSFRQPLSRLSLLYTGTIVSRHLTSCVIYHSLIFIPYKVRYQPQSSLDVQRAPGLLQPYDYPVSLNARPPPLLDDTEELSHSTVPFSSHYLGQMTHRSHFDREFSSPHQLQSRIPQDAPNVGNTVDLRLSSPSDARFAGQDPHEPSPSRQGVGAHDPDHVPPLTEDQKSPDNSPTTSGLKAPRKEVSNVVIACRQWCVPHHIVLLSIAEDSLGCPSPFYSSRSRKIRCDSTRPVCHNCTRRSNVCEYDSAPKRRGPDKRPGTRQRSCKKRPADGTPAPPPKRRRTLNHEDSQSPSLSPSTSITRVRNDFESRPSSSRYPGQGGGIGSPSYPGHSAESFSLSPQSLSPVLVRIPFILEINWLSSA